MNPADAKKMTGRKKTPAYYCRYCLKVWPQSWGFNCPYCYDLKTGNFEKRVRKPHPLIPDKKEE